MVAGEGGVAVPTCVRWSESGPLTFLRFPVLEDQAPVRAVFTGRHGGVSAPPFSGRPGGLNLSYSVGDNPERVAENRRRAVDLVVGSLTKTTVAGLVHGCAVSRVPATAAQTAAGAAAGDGSSLVVGCDALVTDVANHVLLVTCADCVPVYLVDPDRRAIALAHAGWRGTAAGIAAVTVQALIDQFRSRPDRLLAVVGPGIGPCCYEVDAPVAVAMRQHPDGTDWLQPGGRPGHFQLDLWRANRDQLLAAGLAPARVWTADLCTACTVSRLFSHRAEAGRAGRQAALLKVVPGGMN